MDSLLNPKLHMRVLILTLIISLSSCAVNKNIPMDELVGEYQYEGEYGITSSIAIKSNRQFVYKWSAGLNSGTTIGTWQQEGEHLLLNSKKQPGERITQQYEIVEEYSTNNPKITIKVIDHDGHPVPFVDCQIKTTHEKVNVVSNEKGVCEFKTNDTVEKVTLAYIGFKTVEYTPSIKANHFEIMLKKEGDHYTFFTNAKWKIRKGKLVAPPSKPGEKQVIYNKVE